ncbi:hypothetical protein [Microvirga massiliensis]|uniref:hypothetical protein n=1 Tax=Microvirga massiliensis TaxID=1033741 RepID=UPI000AB3E0E5|nr:hypothetical protein [Microvirga massiliensis]
MSAPLVSQFSFEQKPVRAVCLDRRWWLFASDVACCLQYPVDSAGRVRTEAFFLNIPEEGRCQAPLLGPPGTDLVPLVACSAVVEKLRAHPTEAGQAFLDWLTGIARFGACQPADSHRDCGAETKQSAEV